MKYLHAYCESFQEEHCDKEIIDAFMPKKIKPGEEIPLWPIGPELERLNQICMNCEHANLFIENRDCPICGSNNLEVPLLKAISYGTKTPSRTVYIYKCLGCHKTLYSLNELK